ncbi:hypothetical protein KSC_017720 [Ktedonobacter sp. SOSP1-52]|nr:hypothetical protein KSC_017720 [Ktedonobacter sp. SOSP1-52]
MQYADRFHLLKNLRESLEGLLARHLAAEYKQQTQATLDEQGGTNVAAETSSQDFPSAGAPAAKPA